MRCREVRRALIGRDHGSSRMLIDPTLRGHLDRCPACAAEERLERLLRRDLDALRAEPLPTIDVRGDVMERIRRVGRIDRDEVPARQLGWAALISVVWVLVLLGGLGLLLPELPGLIEETRGLGRALGGAVAGVIPVLLTLLAVPLKLAGVALRTLGNLATLAGRLQPLGMTAIALSYVAMMATIALVVGRDLHRSLPALANGRKSGR